MHDGGYVAGTESVPVRHGYDELVSVCHTVAVPSSLLQGTITDASKERNKINDILGHDSVLDRGQPGLVR